MLVVHQNDIKPYEGREQPGSEGESETKKMESESESENGEENGIDSEDEGGEQMVAEERDEGGMQSSPVTTSVGKEVWAP